MLGKQLLIGAVMIGLTVILHVGGILLATAWLRIRVAAKPSHRAHAEAIRMFVITVLGIFLVHMIEICGWAVLYVQIGQFDSFERALYFSSVTFTTLGFGDITLDTEWQILSGLEAANGIILFGVSTAFIFTVLKFLFEAAGIVAER